MKSLVKNLVAKVLNISPVDISLLRNGYGVVIPKTPEADINELISKIRPVESPNKPLIRLGPSSDGGYLVPDDLVGITACFSPGVDQVSGFEKQCAELGMQVYMADRSVDKPAENHASFNFIKKHLGSVCDNDTISLEEWVASSAVDDTSDLLLQMDIEGAEYESLLNVPDALLKRFRIITIEFHGVDEWLNPTFFKIATQTFNRLLHHHRCVHIHPNNCLDSLRYRSLELPRLLEITFLRKDRIGDFETSKLFPHALDCDNTSNPPLPLPGPWYNP